MIEFLIANMAPIMFGTLYAFTLIGLLVNLLTDLTYTLVDPRIDFDSREV